MSDLDSPPIPFPEARSSTSAPATLANGGPDARPNGHTSVAVTVSNGDSLPNMGDIEARCGGCALTIDQESGGVVVAFGSSLWHVDCFKCAKCKDKVSADTNLLLLSDGSPVCGNCSYQCFVCKQAITEEAIMTGDESYHAHCFTCRTCKRKIEELVFAKTSQGIYCMACHNERVAKSRRHAEAKRQRAARKEKEREAKEAADAAQTFPQPPAPPPSAQPAPSSQSPSSQTLSQPISPARAPSPSGTRPEARSPEAPIGLGVFPLTTKAERRRSISPALQLADRSTSPALQQLADAVSTDPRLSPLPPSPLRASFTDIQNPPEDLSPVSPSPQHLGLEGFPFRRESNSIPWSSPDSSLPLHPPRKSSLIDLTPSTGSQGTPPSVLPLPPDLPTVSFSLSDPDFASLLNGGKTVDLDDTPPPSPNKTRSPSTDLLSSTPFLRTRQPSTESTNSLSRFGPNSSFAELSSVVAANSGKEVVEVKYAVLAGVIAEMEDLKEIAAGLRNKYSGAKRTSQQYSEGLTVAGEEYDKEVTLRRELEAEVTRLKAEVHSQNARLSVISGDERRQENMRRRSNDLANSLSGLEKDISRLKAQRDITMAEVEELQNKEKRESTDESVSQSLTNRLETIREQYKEELEPLTAQREALQREISEMRETREQFIEESTALAAKNDELAELNAQLSRQVEALKETVNRAPSVFQKRGHPSNSPSIASLATSATLQDVPEETVRVVKATAPQPIEAAPARRFKWYKSSKGPSVDPSPPISISRPMNAHKTLQPQPLNHRPSTEFVREHSFQQHSTMRFTRCELCTEKMWGLQEVRCASCGVVCHSRCADKLPKACTGAKTAEVDPTIPSMFGRELAEQAAADRVEVPVIVTKSIAAVEAIGMEYEGIYRKTGGSSQSKQIQQLFERGDYDAFDLTNIEIFNDISSITSNLKTYFRQLPNPLLTHALHESFVAAATIKDLGNRQSALSALLQELPREHYNTLRVLMLHLNRVMAASATNLMTSQNLGVVFGPTLMRSADPNREFGDMGGKAMCIQWMVENAPTVFTQAR